MDRWVILFKALGNINRLKIIRMLGRGREMTVTEISEELKISIKATSQHLVILHSLDILESTGKKGHVFYVLKENMPAHMKNAIKLFS